MKKRHSAALIIVILAIIIFLLIYTTVPKGIAVVDFETCVAAGNAVMESYPRQCRSEDGRLFVEAIEQPVRQWENDGIILMQNQDTNEYACFGCNNELCIDPAPIMQQVDETVTRYCNDNFEVVEN